MDNVVLSARRRFRAEVRQEGGHRDGDGDDAPLLRDFLRSLDAALN